MRTQITIFVVVILFSSSVVLGAGYSATIYTRFNWTVLTQQRGASAGESFSGQFSAFVTEGYSRFIQWPDQQHTYINNSAIRSVSTPVEYESFKALYFVGQKSVVGFKRPQANASVQLMGAFQDDTMARSLTFPGAAIFLDHLYVAGGSYPAGIGVYAIDQSSGLPVATGQTSCAVPSSISLGFGTAALSTSNAVVITAGCSYYVSDYYTNCASTYSASLADVLVYYPTAGSPCSSPMTFNLTYRRTRFAVAKSSQYIVFAGGRDRITSGNPLSSVIEVYRIADIEAKNFTATRVLALSEPRQSVKIAVSGNLFLFIGGEKATDVASTVVDAWEAEYNYSFTFDIAPSVTAANATFPWAATVRTDDVVVNRVVYFTNGPSATLPLFPNVIGASLLVFPDSTTTSAATTTSVVTTTSAVTTTSVTTTTSAPTTTTPATTDTSSTTVTSTTPDASATTASSTTDSATATSTTEAPTTVVQTTSSSPAPSDPGATTDVSVSTETPQPTSSNGCPLPEPDGFTNTRCVDSIWTADSSDITGASVTVSSPLRIEGSLRLNGSNTVLRIHIRNGMLTPVGVSVVGTAAIQGALEIVVDNVTAANDKFVTIVTAGKVQGSFSEVRVVSPNGTCMKATLNTSDTRIVAHLTSGCKSKSKLWIFILAGVGGVILLAALVGAVVYFIVKRRRRSELGYSTAGFNYSSL